jgi:non-ribosomal peptide synthetase component F
VTGHGGAADRERLMRLLLAERGRSSGGPAPVPRSGLLIGSFAQERMWFWDRATAPRSFLHNVPLAARLAGPVDAGALEAALNRMIDRHESLRTSFALAGDRLVQRVHRRSPITMAVRDLSGAADPEDEAERFGLAEARELFDIARVPLLRATLLRLAPEDHVLLVSAHHIVWDGWSTGLLVDELARHYTAVRAGGPVLPPPPVQYADWAAWQRRQLTGPELRRHLEYWTAELADAPTVHLPAGRTDPGGEPPDGGRTVRFSVPPELVTALSELGRREGATLFMVLLAGLTALAHRLAAAPDLTVGGLIANRTRPEIEPLIGYFVNTVPIRSRTAPGTTFREHLRRIRGTALRAFEHQVVPLGVVSRHLTTVRPDVHDRPLYTVDFMLQTAPRAETDFGDVRLRSVDRNTRTADFDLGVILWQRTADLTRTAGLEGWWEYRTALFDEADIRRLTQGFLTVLETVARDPAVPLSRLPVLAPADVAHAVVHGPPALHEPGPAAPLGPVAADTGSLTSRAFGELTDRYTGRLAELCCRPGTVVALVSSPAPDLVAAACAVLRHGAAVLVLDPAAPPEQLEAALTRARPAVALISPGAEVPLPPGIASAELCAARTSAAGVKPTAYPDGLPAELRLVTHGDGRIGCATTDRGALAARVEALAGALGLTGDDLVAYAPPVPGPLADVLAPLTRGAGLRLLRDGIVADEVAAALTAEPITVLHTGPATLAALLDLPAGRFPRPRRLRRALVSGGLLAGPLARRWRAAFPEVPLTVACGPPETGGLALLDGHPVAGGSVYLVDRELTPVPSGAIGELCCGGAPLAGGYLGDPRSTAERFVPDPWSTTPGARMFRFGLRASRRPGRPVRLAAETGEDTARGGDLTSAEALRLRLAAEPGVREAVVVTRWSPERGAETYGCLVPEPAPPGAGPTRPAGLDRVRLFAGPAQLERALAEAVDRSEPGGHLVVDDVPDLTLLRGFHAAAELDRAGAADSASDVRQRVGRRLRLEDVFAVDPRYFAALPHRLPRVRSVRLRPRSASGLPSYDVLLSLDVAEPVRLPAAELRWTDRPGLDAVRRLLAGRPHRLVLRGLPGAASARLLAAERVLDEPLPGAVVAGLRLATASPGGVTPAELAAVAAEHGYTVTTAVVPGTPGYFDAFLDRAGRQEWPDAAEPAPGDFPDTWCNAPGLRDHIARVVATATRDEPLIGLDAFPRLTDGSVARAALPRPVDRAPASPPVSPAERLIARIWANVLQLAEVGVNELLHEDLGVSLPGAALLADCLSARLGIRLVVADLLRAPTVAELARILPETADIETGRST